MNKDLQVSETIEVNATPEKVWHALTTPKLIAEYLFGTETVTDWKIGSEVIFQGEYEGHKYRDKGIILEIIPNKKLSYSYWSGFSGLEDKPENYSTVACLVEDLGGGKVNFTWTQQGFASEQNQQHAAGGMPDFMKKIKEVMEK